MTQPRKAIVSIASTRYYHITARCVRRAFLCGFDKDTGNCYEHRRQWIEDRIHLLASIFAIDICAYAVMSNHYHLVVRLSPEQMQHLDTASVCERWQCLFKGSLLFQKYCVGESLLAVEHNAAMNEIEIYRNRLCDLSWFMKCLNEPLARMANKEDKCKGHFWEHRYKSQALCTNEALLSAMAYVDLNPIRANMAETPEASENTSIKQRIAFLKEQPTIDLGKAIQEQYEQGFLLKETLITKPLLPFNPDHKSLHEQLPFALSAYIELVDWTGRIIREDKRGFIDNTLPPILQRLNIKPKQWLINSTQFEVIHRRRFGNKPTFKNTA